MYQGCNMKSDEIKETLLKATVVRNDRRTITCEKLMQLAATCRITPARIGALCDELHIKITKCKLGCFS
jgi:hypothetical protein